MSASDPIEPGEQRIESDNVTARIDYLEFLDNETDPQTLDEWADEIDELRLLRELANELPDGVTLVSEYAWKEYAAQDADDRFNLNDNGAYMYFNYDQYADDLQTDYSQVQFGDYTYYYPG